MASTTTAASSTRGEFERQRGELLKEIAEVCSFFFSTLLRSTLPILQHHHPLLHADILHAPPPQSFEHVLANINKLNRNLEAVITVGNEFSSVEALWSTFENVMGKEDEGAAGEGDAEHAEGHHSARKSEEEGGEGDDVKTES